MNIKAEDYEKYKMITLSDEWVDVSCMGASYMEFVNTVTGETAHFPYDLQHYNKMVQCHAVIGVESVTEPEEKRTVGRPLAFNSLEELTEAVELYFETDAYMGEGDSRMYAPTMAGLALALGVDRKTITNYGNKDEFFPAIKKARSRVEVALEQRLYGNNVTGVIFNLKNNFDWCDKQEVKQETTHKMDSSLAERLTGGSRK